MSIQGSVNQLLGTVAAGANLMNREFSEQRKSAEGVTNSMIGRLENSHVSSFEGKTAEQLKKPIEQDRAKLGSNLVDNIKGIKSEKSAAKSLNLYDETVLQVLNPAQRERWKAQAQQRLQQQELHRKFAELVKNPNATQADFNEWRKK